ncbi:MAG: arylsulfotransferase family protein [Solirubrobacterales bacterium]
MLGLALLSGITDGAAGSAQAATVSPGVISQNASIWTEISFRGINKAESGPIKVNGSVSGLHGFSKKEHFDRRGFSLVMGKPFEPAEQVVVQTEMPIAGATDGNYAFTVENLGAPRVVQQRRQSITDGAIQPFRSRPDIRPYRLQVRSRTEEAGDDPIFVGSKKHGNAIFSPSGRLIWFKPMRGTDFRTQTYKGKPVLTWFQAPTVGSGLKRSSYIVADRSYRVIKRIVPGNGYRADSHEFRLTPRGTAYITAYRTVQRDLQPVGLNVDGRVIDSIAQEVDLETGRVIWEWHSLDEVPVSDTYAVRTRREGAAYDYFHINSVIDTPDGNVMVSGRSTSAIYKINRRSGRLIWTLGGKSSDFTFGPGASFSWQHDAEPLSENRVSLFDNADAFVAPAPSAEQSRGLVLRLDESLGLATLENQFLHPNRPLSPSQANTQALPTGNFFVGWGQSPLISEFAADGTLIFDGVLQGANSTYRAYRLPWSGRPRGPVDIATRRANGVSTAWVSWNGDVDVRRWRIFTGPNLRNLEPVGIRPREGFETRLRLPGKPRLVRIQGLEADGTKIASTPATVVRK